MQQNLFIEAVFLLDQFLHMRSNIDVSTIEELLDFDNLYNFYHSQHRRYAKISSLKTLYYY